MNILITGATGYVGSRLVAELSKSHQVKSLVRDENSYRDRFRHLNTTVCKGDLIDLESIRNHFYTLNLNWLVTRVTSSFCEKK